MKFSTNDIVKYELSWWGKPRWISNRDRGGSGHWEEGKVIKIDDTEVIVDGRTGRSIWPLEGHRYYDFLQWSWAGYLQVVSSNVIRNKCTCGAEVVFGKDSTHSHWCDINN